MAKFVHERQPLVEAVMHVFPVRLQTGGVEEGLAGRSHGAPLLTGGPEDVGFKLLFVLIRDCTGKASGL